MHTKEENTSLPILYSFRRCPYAMRARIALHQANILWNHREVVLRDLPSSLLEFSPKGTVPVLVLPDGKVIEESLDIMHWALLQNDPDHWLADEDQAWIARFEDEFKGNLDRYKYPNRFDDVDLHLHRELALTFLFEFDEFLSNRSKTQLVDIAVFPFVRQFANHDRAFFYGLSFTTIHGWLKSHVDSALFGSIMTKHKQWQQPR
jgi:glutathione S-transferase